MAKTRKIFERVEKKYILDSNKLDLLMKRLKYKYIQEDDYSSYSISNIYFDNDNYEVIRRSISKPKYKEKLRVRKYNNNDEIFIELKKKAEGVVYKRRIVTNKDSAIKILNNENVFNNQIEKEIQYFINYYNAFPCVFVSYQRDAYVGIEDSELRITIDSNIRSSFENLTLENNLSNPLFEEPTYILEIKANGAYPLWLVGILNELEIFPQSFSKIGNIYKQEVINRRIL